MSTDINITDEVLMAYADGELDVAQAARAEQAMQQDASVAARVAQHRALRAQLQSGLSGVLSEPVPTRLLSMLQARPATNSAADKVVDLAQARQQKAAPARRWHNREWFALAASLIAGVVIGMYALSFNSSGLIATRDGALLAQGKLANALTTQLASSTAADSSVHIGISFRDREGNYCRSFAIQGSSLAGLACHEHNNWRVQMLTEAKTQAGEFRQAGSATPPAVLALIEQQIDGEPLDTDMETAALREGWQ